MSPEVKSILLFMKDNDCWLQQMWSGNCYLNGERVDRAMLKRMVDDDLLEKVYPDAWCRFLKLTELGASMCSNN